MIFTRRLSTVILTVMISGFLITFQNCRGTYSSFKSSSSQSTVNNSGNGAGYDGKTYGDVGMPGECPAGTQLKSELVVRKDQSVYLLQENCQALNPPRDVTASMQMLVPHPLYDSVVMRGAMSSVILDYLSSPTIDFANFEITIMRCQKVISNTQSLSVAVLFRLDLIGAYKGSAYYYYPSATPEFVAIPTNNDSVQLTVLPPTYGYSSPHPKWNLAVDALYLDPNDPFHRRASFTYQDSTGDVTVNNLDCYDETSRL